MISEDTKSDIKTAATATKTAAKSVIHDGQATAAQLAETAKDRASATAAMVRDKASDVASDVAAKASHVAAVAGEKADAATGAIANEGHRLAQTLRSAASEHGETVQGRVLDVVAGGVESVSDSLKDRKLTDLFAEVQGYARRNPGAFVVGAAVAGFALARFMRAGERRS